MHYRSTKIAPAPAPAPASLEESLAKCRNRENAAFFNIASLPSKTRHSTNMDSIDLALIDLNAQLLPNIRATAKKFNPRRKYAKKALKRLVLRFGMVPALVDGVLKVSCLLRREQRSQRPSTL